MAIQPRRPIPYIWQHERWPELRWDADSVLMPLTQLALERGRLLAEVDALGLADRAIIEAGAVVVDALGTSAIEGRSLPPATVRSSVARRLGLADVGLAPPRRDVEGLVDVLLDATREPNEGLTAERLWSWQAALFPTGRSGLQRIVVGGWRTTPIAVQSGPIGREQIHFRGPPAARLEGEMGAFLDWWNASGTLDGVHRAGVAHLWIETIQPFEDGNGRIGRAVADRALAATDGSRQRHYSLSNQICTDRADYYRALRAAQQGDLEVTSWLLWFIGCVERAVRHSRAQVATALHRRRLLTRAGEAGLNPRQRKALSKLVEAGPGGFVGGLDNRKYRVMTGASRATATRDLGDLERQGFLVRSNSGGRSTRYELDWGETPSE